MRTKTERWSGWALLGLAMVLWIGWPMTGAAAPYHDATYDSGFQNSGVIPDGSLNGWSDTRTVTGSGVRHVEAVRVKLLLSGGYNGDLYGYLVHETGFAVLLNRVGVGTADPLGYTNAGFNVTLSATGAQNIHFHRDHGAAFDGDGRLTGTWKPDARRIDPLSAVASFDALDPGATADLGAFANMDPHGEWTLFLADVVSGGGDTTVLEWGLEIDAVVEPAIQLVVTAVNGGAAVTAGTPFAVAVEARDLNGTAANVAADTAITLSVTTGAGTLAGTLTGTLSAGTSSVTFSGITYSRAETGVVLTVARTGGDSLASGNSGAFDVNPGALAKLQVLMPGETAAPGSVTGKTGTPTTQAVGVAVNVTVNAVDANWNPLSGVTHTVALTASDASATLPANAALVAGTGTFSLTFLSAGSWTVTASDITDGAVTANTGTATTVQAGTQTITFAAITDQTYQVAGVPLVASASSGLPVSFAVTSGPATVSGSTLSLTGAGTVTVQATQAGNANWNAATPVSRTFEVAPKSVTPSVVAAPKTYDGTDTASLTGRSLTGVIHDDDVSLSGGSATFDTAAVGTGKTVTVTGLSLAGTEASNYVLSTTTAATVANITRATVTVASGLTADNKVYDGTTAATIRSNAVVLAGVVSADLSSVRLSTNGYSAEFDTETVGTGKTVVVTGLTLTGAPAGNYSLTQPELTADITVGAVAQLVFVTQAGGATAGSAFSQQPVLRTEDAFGHPSTSGLGTSLIVTLDLFSGTGPLQGTATADIGTAAGNGTVSFTNLRIDARGTKQLRARATGLPDLLGEAFTVANVTPVAGTLDVGRPRNVPLRLRVAQLVAAASDLNGDTLTLVSVSANSTHGATVLQNGNYVLYSLPPDGNVADDFSYTVTDGIQSVSGLVRIALQPDPSGMTANIVSSGLDAQNRPTMVFVGVPGYSYRVQRTQDMSGVPLWTPLDLIPAPATGVFQYTDTAPPSGSLFYRAANE